MKEFSWVDWRSIAQSVRFLVIAVLMLFVSVLLASRISAEFLIRRFGLLFFFALSVQLNPTLERSTSSEEAILRDMVYRKKLF